MSGSARINPFLLALLGCLLAGLSGCGRTLEVGVLGGACTGRQFQSCAVDGNHTVRLFCDASTHTWALLETCADRCHVDWTGDEVITTCFNDFFTNGSPGFAQDTVSARAPDGCGDGCGDTCGDNECSPGEMCTADCGAEPVQPCGGPCPSAFACHEDSNQCEVQTCVTPAKWASNNVQKVTAWAYSAKTEGCDLDGDGLPNNVLGKWPDLYKTTGAVIAEGIATGKLVMLFEAPAWNPDGKPFALRLLDGTPASKPACEMTNAGCAYLVKPASYDRAAPGLGACPPRAEFQTAVSGGTLTATAAKSMDVHAALLDLESVIRMQGVQITAQVTGTDTWNATSSGRLCGYLTRADLDAAVDRIPAKSMAKLGDRATVKSLLGSIFKPDLDIDGDGTKDAISASFDFSTAAATITGVAAP